MLKEIQRGIKWSAIQQWMIAFLNVATTLILVNFLSPGQFGVFTKASVIIGLLTVFQELGLSSFIISQKNVTNDDYISIQNCLLLTSTSLFIIFYFQANFFLSLLFKNTSSEMVLIMKICLISLILENLFLIYRTYLVKEMKFDKLAKNNILGNLFGCGFAITFVSVLGIFVLPIKQITTLLISGLLNKKDSNLYYNLNFKIYNVFNEREYLLGLSSSQILTYLSKNLDYVIIGRYLGSEILGQYSIAYKIMMFPVKRFSDLIGRSIFPALSKISSNLDRVKKYYFESVLYIAVFTAPLMLFVSFNSSGIVELFFDNEKWFILDELIRFMCITAIFQSISTPLGYLYRLISNTKKLFFTTLVTSIITISVFFFGVKIGLEETIIIYMLTFILVIFPFSSIVIFKDFNISFFEMIIMLAKPMIASLTCVLIFSGIQLILNIEIDLFNFSIITIIFSFSYFFLMKFFGINILAIFNSIIRS